MVINKKYILNADPRVLIKTFERLAESIENIETKEVILAVLKVKVENPKPVNDFKDVSLLPGNSSRVFESFQQLFPEENLAD